MKNVKIDLQKILVYLGLLLLVVNLTSCSDDDDAMEMTPSGAFAIGEEYTLSENSITLESITVGQDSWLVAVNSGNENTNTFISDPVMLNKGINSNVELTLNDDAITDDGTGQEIVLKLYADNPNSGTAGEWDPSDEPIMEDNVLLTETITVFADTPTMSDFDADNSGSLDRTELPAAYQNNFDDWDADDDGLLSSDEFNTTTFSLTDANDDDGIDQDEWNMGFTSFYGNWIDDDFATFDANSDGSLTGDEWNTAFSESDWFGTFDADDDDGLDEDEWDTGLFDDWDANDDDLIDEDEFDLFSAFTQNW